MPNPILISGIQPSGRLHLGNYLGALKNFVELQGSGKYECFFFIADLHSLTENFSPKEKAGQIADLAINYLAAGLDPKKSTLFIQSRIPAHTELAWILDCITPMGELSRMTQFKDKSLPTGQAGESGNINAGLFTYPVLMAADIILYNAAFVPVGDDQDQHLELTRTLARKFNNRFGETFIEPKGLHTSIPRLMSLADPTKKMSKSSPSGCVFIDDSPEEIKQKFTGAVTDSGREIIFRPEEKPGISNLLLIASAISGKAIPELEKDLAGKSYVEFKAVVAELVADHFAPFRANKAKLQKNPGKTLKIFEKGTAAASKIANKKIISVKEKIGLI